MLYRRGNRHVKCLVYFFFSFEGYLLGRPSSTLKSIPCAIAKKWVFLGIDTARPSTLTVLNKTGLPAQTYIIHIKSLANKELLIEIDLFKKSYYIFLLCACQRRAEQQHNIGPLNFPLPWCVLLLLLFCSRSNMKTEETFCPSLPFFFLFRPTRYLVARARSCVY